MAAFRFSRNANKSYNLNAMMPVKISSSSMASQVHLDQIRTWIVNRMIQGDIESDNGIASLIRNHVAAHVALMQPLYVAAIAAPAVIPAAHANPAPPQGLEDDTVAAIDAHFQAIIAPHLAAAPANHPNYGYDPSPHIYPTEMEYDLVEWQFLQALAHSGFTSQGTYNQIAIFKVQNLPSDPGYYTLAVDEIIDNFPTGITPYNVGAAFATTIATNAKKAGIEWTWGKRHGCPAAIPWAGFATWEYISAESKLISEEYKTELKAMSAAAIRSKQVIAFVDPERAADQEYSDILQAANHVNSKHERNVRNRKEVDRRRKGLGSRRYRNEPEGSGDENEDDSTYFRRSTAR